MHGQHHMAEVIDDAQVLLISIHSQYAHLILSGEKRVELRRRFNITLAGSRMVIYATSPTAAIIGHVQIKAVECLPTDEIWMRHGAAAAIAEEDFESYFSGVDRGCAVLLSDPIAYDAPITLRELRSKHGLTPPQSYIFLRDAHRDIISYEQN